MVAGVDVRNVGLNRGRKGVGLELCAAGVGVAVAGGHRAPGGLADREVCKADVGLAVAISRDCGVTRSTGVVILRFQNVEASGANVGHAYEKARGQLTLRGKVPFIGRGNVIVAAGVVAHSNLVERWNVGEVCGSRERAREFGIVRRLPAIAMQGGLRRRLRAEGIAERTGTGRRGRGAVASRGKNELWTERPLVHKAVAEHAHDAGVVEDASAAAETGFTIAEHVIGQAQTRSKSGPIGI